MGMVSSALYRYFASRDDLLTALIIDAYNDLGDTAEAADDGYRSRNQLRATLASGDHALSAAGPSRQPSRVRIALWQPGPRLLRHPQDTIVAAARMPVVLARIPR